MGECGNKARNAKQCACTYAGCERHGVCCECLQYHRRSRELPGCLFPPEAEKTYDRSLEKFLEVWSSKARKK